MPPPPPQWLDTAPFLTLITCIMPQVYAKTQIGTPCYMAPEVWQGRPYALSSDLWSLGCVLYEMMMFATPFQAANMQELKVRVTSVRC